MIDIEKRVLSRAVCRELDAIEAQRGVGGRETIQRRRRVIGIFARNGHQGVREIEPVRVKHCGFVRVAEGEVNIREVERTRSAHVLGKRKHKAILTRADYGENAARIEGEFVLDRKGFVDSFDGELARTVDKESTRACKTTDPHVCRVARSTDLHGALIVEKLGLAEDARYDKRGLTENIRLTGVVVIHIRDRHGLRAAHGEIAGNAIPVGDLCTQNTICCARCVKNEATAGCIRKLNFREFCRHGKAAGINRPATAPNTISNRRTVGTVSNGRRRFTKAAAVTNKVVGDMASFNQITLIAIVGDKNIVHRNVCREVDVDVKARGTGKVTDINRSTAIVRQVDAVETNSGIRREIESLKRHLARGSDPAAKGGRTVVAKNKVRTGKDVCGSGTADRQVDRGPGKIDRAGKTISKVGAIRKRQIASIFKLKRPAGTGKNVAN